MQFLLDNPLIIVILVGIISSIFKKGKNETKPTKKKSKNFWETVQLPNFDSIPEVKPLQKAEVYHEEPVQPVRSIQDDYLEAQRKADSLKRDAEELERKIRSNEVKRSIDAPTLQEKSDFQVDSNKLADAVIWSEILGPPRARKPHRSMHR
ncbi:hypothetical protein EKG37_05425 [Robertmurraya yapensis]|uniref:Uncharacterized protein n=2 Tax=Bacillaceae TaxID=186817 RepID=A0A3S0IJ54_9BACI|nr:hypothetical protein [Bacillus yapensis]RTR35319.1 hypothetical protein EKG37_05425 [Bacillus yapensis]TKS97828.1 hypothetical protein FAR12_05425 [Bacillus yapensis]